MVLRAISFAIAVMLALIACNSFQFDDELPVGSSSSSSPDGVPPSGSSSSLSPSSGDGGGPSSSSLPDGGSSSSEEALAESSSSGVSPSSSSSEAVVCADADKCGGQCYDRATHFCSNGVPYEYCGGDTYMVSSQICCGGEKRAKALYGCCADVSYPLSGYGCRGGVILAICGEDRESLYDPSQQFCASDWSAQWLCGGKPYDYPGQDCVDNVVVGDCGGEPFSPDTEFCHGGESYPLCEGKGYDPASQFCQGGSAVTDKCGGAEFTAAQFCSGGVVKDKCGGAEYNPETEFCGGDGTVQGLCGSAPYDPATQFCQAGAVKELCGGAIYAASQFCQPGTDEVKDLCGGETYTSAQGCCVGSKYTLASQFCQSGSNAVKELCGGAIFTAAQFCSGTSIVGKCGGAASGAEYNPSTEGCCGSNKYTIASQGCCGTATFTQASQFCYASSSKVGSFCGNNPQKSYDPDKYGCRSASGTSPDGIYLKTDISYESKSYKAVLIGSQTWMAENLNYNASGSKCGSTLSGSGTVGDANTSTCDTYGRLYNWATAMGIASSYNTALYNPSSSTKYRGVCPAGWHLPSDADWNTLVKYVNPGCSDNSICADAGTKLKANSALWSTNTGTDDYGFSALPGGNGTSDGSFSYAGSFGNWWSTSENNASNAYNRNVNYSNAYVNRDYGGKTYLFQVRCVQD